MVFCKRITKVKNELFFLKTLFKVFGFKPKFLFFLVFRLFFTFFIKISSFLDNLFFSSYKKTKIIKPVFLLGHPRSGTSFLHRFIVEKFTETKGLKLNELIIPSIFASNILQPIFNRLKNREENGLYDPKIHKTGLFMEETDDAAVFFRYFDGLFYWLFVNAWKNFKSEEELIEDLRKTVSKPKFLKFREILFKKKFHNSNLRIVDKSFSLFLQMEELYEKFPDCKLVVLIRDPLEVIPSSFSLEEHVQNKLTGFESLPEDKKIQYFKNLYLASKFFYRELDRQIELVPKKNIFIITHNDLINKFEKSITDLAAFCDFKITNHLLDEFKSMASKQSNHKSEHKYSLEKYGLSKEQILNDFHFVYKKYFKA
jgi:omega-hydroxy-beta-dihydromenaquinone-9 sulfotransferase